MRDQFNTNQFKNKLKSMKNFKFQSYIGASLLVLTLATSCNSDFDKVTPGAPDVSGNVNYKVPKVLYIIADGARGTSVRDAESINIKSLIGNSIYTWTGLADTTRTDATNWADMITGVKKEKHGVISEDFVGNKLTAYPSIFTRIKSANPKLRIATFTSSDVVKTQLTGGADIAESFAGNDDATKSRIIDFIKTDTASLIMGQFSGVEAAGKSSGFDNSFAPYKAAINSFDAKVGEMVAAVKARPTYAKENWLVIITSNRGGQFALPANQDDKTVFSNTNANVFTVIYNASFKPTFIGKPFLGNSFAGSAARYKGDPERTQGLVSLDKSPNFNFGSETDFSISVKIKKRFTKNRSRGDYFYQWPSVLGKRANSGWGENNPGWDFSLFYNGWRFFASGGPNWGTGIEIGGLDISGDTWHDLTVVIERKADGFKYVRVYTDGVLGVTNQNGGSIANPVATEIRLNGQPNFDNTAPLRVGYSGGEIDGDYGNINVNLAELKIWKVALPDAVVKQYACDPSMDSSHPYYDYLVGYWHLDEGSGSTMKDLGPFEANMTLQGTYVWESFTDLLCSPTVTALGTLVPKNSDLPAQIISWFNIPRQESWALDGKVWISN
ncbi:MAG: DUF4983 domain-containing protein [Pedobacter sp.]|nr:MAG: DUF4983 domain-containing protein [Pedobacter sp.]